MKRPKDRLNRVMVIGATPSGIAATNKLGELGIPVTLIDSEPDMDLKLSRSEWCLESVHGNGFRQRSPENVAAEMKLLKERYQIDRLRVVDDVDGISRSWLETWAQSAESMDAVIPFEALNELERQDIPLLDVRDSL